MLVLSRKVGESLVIADHIEIQILASNYHRVKIGIVASQKILVDRKEIKEKREHSPL